MFSRVCRYLILILSACLAVAAFATAASARTPANVNWPLNGRNLANNRFAPVDQIAPGNVGRLRPAWVFHTGVLDPKASLEVSPVEAGGRVFVTTGHDDVFALDSTSGKLLWVYHPESTMPPLKKLSICCGRDNRGVAYAHGTIYLARLDDVLVALNAVTGQVKWQTPVASWRRGYSMTMAPQVVGGRVIVGLSGGEFLARGAAIAYSARTGREIWRFGTTISRTWHGRSWLSGGAPVWGTPAVDRRLGLVYVTTGNAAPDFNGVSRAGRNLYASSIVALRIRNGRIRWHFQEVHHDLWDYDSPQPPVLFALRHHGGYVPALGHCSKDGQYFVLNRVTGRPLWPVRQERVPAGPRWQHAWPTQPISSVQPLTPQRVLYTPPGMHASPEFTPPNRHGVLIQPGAQAGCEWPPAAYSPRTGDVYYGARYQPVIYKAYPGNHKPNKNKEFVGSKEVTPIPGIHYFGIFGATNMRTGRVVWRIRVPQLAASGMLVAGSLAFFGEENGRFHAVDAATGRRLWSFNGTRLPHGGGANGSPIAYKVNGREFVVMAFGGNAADRHERKQYSPVGDAIVGFALPRR
ncbi:MAG TPA: PQQ-binding-like beta-propeller repeat protein [Solirubrobacteraceae bacterium]|nr:PQQ-binding-like beta-propeller repeat protein [Solirubrobacteraceae bacterium]